MNTWLADKPNEGTQELVTGKQSIKGRAVERGGRLLNSSHIICMSRQLSGKKLAYSCEKHIINVLANV